MRFEEERGDRDLLHTVSHVAKFSGVDHLINRTHSQSSLIERYDIDIKLSLAIALFIMLRMVKRLVCKKLDEEEQAVDVYDMSVDEDGTL